VSSFWVLKQALVSSRKATERRSFIALPLSSVPIAEKGVQRQTVARIQSASTVTCASAKWAGVTSCRPISELHLHVLDKYPYWRQESARATGGFIEV
jgi:hypothetical protein